MGSHGITPGCMKDIPLSCSYDIAMEALSSLITQRARGNGSKRAEKYDLMPRYLKILGLEGKIDDLKVIHIAGTKGKGSTCAFSEAILRECGFRTGLFISPHLIDVTERFRINGLDISKENFLKYFWECWFSLKDNIEDDLKMPALFHFLCLLAFKIFSSEKVDVAILEVGLGGRLDATNVIREPIVCGITSLGMDHMEILGDTIGKIASEKAGIFKHRVPAFTAPQHPEAMTVLQMRAAELMVPLSVVPPLHDNVLNGFNLGLAGDHQFINAGLAVSLCKCWLQRTQHLPVLWNDKLEATLPEEFQRALSVARLPGRAQIICDDEELSGKIVGRKRGGELIFYLDGAHSPESMNVCAKWYSNAVVENRVSKGRSEELIMYLDLQSGSMVSPSEVSKKVLLFNCMETRDPKILLPRLFKMCCSSDVFFSKALFVPSLSTYHRVDSSATINMEEMPVDLSWQLFLQRTWENIIHGKDSTTAEENCFKPEKQGIPSTEFLFGDSPNKCNPSENHFPCSAVIPSLPLAIKWLRDCVEEYPGLRLQVLVTGSLHLVGDVLKLLR